MSSIFLEKVKQNLALLIIKEEFGEEAKLVLEGIFDSQAFPTLDRIMSYPQIVKKENARDIIILLIKNGILKSQIYKESERIDMQGKILYQPDYTHIFGYMRHIQYISHVTALFGYEAKLIMEYFTYNTCGTIQDCIQTILQENSSATSADDLKQSFIRLVKNNYLTRDLGIENQENNQTETNKDNEMSIIQQSVQSQSANKSKSAQKNKRKKGALLEENEDGDVVQKKLQLSSDSNSLLKKQQNDLQQMYSNQNHKFGSSNQEPEILAGFGQMMEIEGTNDNLLIKDIKNDLLYVFYINNRKFIHDFRTKEIGQVIQGKIGGKHKLIVQTMLDKSHRIGKSKEFKKTEQLSLGQIINMLPTEFRHIKESEIKEGLDALKLDGTKFIVAQYIDAITHYSVNVYKIMKNIQFRHIAKIIERKYDVNTARIFRVLKQYKCLDEKTIGDLCLLTTDLVRKSLQNLVKDGFLIYDTAYEKDKQNSAIQAYQYNKQDVSLKIQEFYYQAIFNLKVKLQKAYEDSEEIEESINRKERLKEWYKVIKMIKTLEIAILELDSALLCFSEY